MTLFDRWSLIRSVSPLAVSRIDEILNTLAQYEGDPRQRNSLVGTAYSLSHSANAVALFSFRVYFATLAKVFKSVNQIDQVEIKDTIYESLFSIRDLYIECARSEYESFDRVLNAIGTIAPLIELKTDPSIFLVNSIPSNVKNNEVITRTPDQEKMTALIKVANKLVATIESEGLTKDALSLAFKLFSTAKLACNSNQQANYLWGTQILIAQIANDRITPSEEHKIIVLQSLLTIIDDTTSISQKMVRRLCASVLWNGIETPELAKFGTAFGMAELFEARVKEISLVFEPNIMCTINSAIRNQFRVNITRLEYWSARLHQTDQADHFIRKLLIEIVDVASFVGIPLEKIPVHIEDFESEQIALYVSDLIWWFELVNAGLEARFSSSRDNHLNSSKAALLRLIKSSIEFSQNQLFKGKTGELVHIAGALKKASQVAVFISNPLSQDLINAAYMAATNTVDDDQLTKLYSKLDLILGQLTYPKTEVHEYRPVIECFNQENLPAINKVDSGVSFKQQLKSLIHRFEQPTEYSIFKAAEALAIIMDLESHSQHEKILQALSDCDQVMAHLQLDAGFPAEVPESAIAILKEFSRNGRLNTASQQIEAPAIDVALASSTALAPLCELTPAEGVPAELFAIFLKEREMRHKSLDAALLVSNIATAKREVHSLAGIHRQLGYPESAQIFKSIELEIDDTAALPRNIIERANLGFQSASTLHSDTSENTKNLDSGTSHPSIEIPASQPSLAPPVTSNDDSLIAMFEAEAKDLCASIESQLNKPKMNFDFVLRSIHTLKGSASMCGYSNLANLAHNIEERINTTGDIDSQQNRHDIQQLIVEINSLIESAVQPAAVLSPSVLRSIYSANENSKTLRLAELEISEHSAPLEDLLLSQTNDDAIASSITLDASVISTLINNLSTIQNQLSNAAGIVNKIKTRSSEQTAIANRQLKSTSNLIYTNNEDHTDDLVATDRELALKSIQEEANQSKSMSFETRLDATKFLERFDNINKLTQQVSQQLSTSMNVSLDEFKTRASKLVEQCSLSTGVNCKLIVTGNNVEVSRPLLRDIQMMTEHLIRNSFAHAFNADSENPTIKIKIEQSSIGPEITVEDNGSGINLEKVRSKAISIGLIQKGDNLSDQDLAQLIFHPGFSTNDAADQLSGRGVGMDVVHDTAVRRNGTITTTTHLGKGTRFEISLADSSRAIPSIIVGSGNLKIAIPSAALAGTASHTFNGTKSISYKNTVYRVIRLSDIAEDHSSGPENGYLLFLRSKVHGVSVAIYTSSFPKTKSLTAANSPFATNGILGYSTLFDGSIAAIVDPISIIPISIEILSEGYRVIKSIHQSRNNRILVVDDSPVARAKLAEIFGHHGFVCDFAENGREGLKAAQAREYALISTDLEMPFSNGIDLAHGIHSTLAEKAPPLLMVTSRSSDRHQAISAHAGIDVFISKTDAVNGIANALKALDKANRLHVA